MKTRLTELLEIEAPIICGGMMRVGTADLAAAVIVIDRIQHSEKNSTFDD